MDKVLDRIGKTPVVRDVFAFAVLGCLILLTGFNEARDRSANVYLSARQKVRRN